VSASSKNPNDPNEPTGEWLTVSEVADWLKVSEHHVYGEDRQDARL